MNNMLKISLISKKILRNDKETEDKDFKITEFEFVRNYGERRWSEKKKTWKN